MYLHGEHELAAVASDALGAGPSGVPQLLHDRPGQIHRPDYPCSTWLSRCSELLWLCGSIAAAVDEEDEGVGFWVSPEL
ncbi:Os02g0189150, partial [Oryza sativa Japonica Group]